MFISSPHLNRKIGRVKRALNRRY